MIGFSLRSGSAAVLLALVGCSFIAPDKFWALQYLHWPAQVLLILAALLCLIRLPASLQTSLQTVPQALYYWLPGSTLAVAIFGFLILFPLRLLLPPPDGMGDSLLLLQSVPLHAHLFGYLDSFDELLELYFHSKFYLLTSSWLGWSVQTGFAISSYLAYVPLAILALVLLQGRKLWQLILWLSLLGFNARMALFAGYVENYTWTSFYLMALIWLPAEFLERATHSSQASTSQVSLKLSDRQARREVLLLGVLAAWGILHHIIVAFALPALAYFIWVRARGRLIFAMGLTFLAAVAALPLLALIWSYFFIAHPFPISLVDAHVAHPPYLTPGAWLRPAHLWAILNLILLCTPLIVLALPGILLLKSKDTQDPGAIGMGTSSRIVIYFNKIINTLAPRPVDRFLGIAAFTFLVEMFLHRAQIGFPADWDLFSFASIPVNLYLFYRISYLIEQVDRNDGAGQESLKNRKGVLIGQALRSILAGSLIFSGVWSATFIIHLNQADVASPAYLSQAAIVAGAVLTQTTTDELWLSELDADKRRAYVKAYQFIYDSSKKLQNAAEAGVQLAGSPSPQELLGQLQQGENKLRKLLRDNNSEASSSDFRAAYRAWQYELGPLNVQIQAYNRLHLQH